MATQKNERIEHVEHVPDDDAGPLGIEKADADEFGARAKSDPREIRLVKKFDFYILPVLWIMYFLNYLDRNAMINGKLDTLAEDLNLQDVQYNTCVSILFVGYLAGQVPSNMLLNRVRPSWYMAGFMVMWSLISLLTYKVYDYKTMLVVRLLLGVVEAPFYPGALYMLSLFYTRKEIATRMSIFYTGNMLSSAFAGLIAAGVFSGLGGKYGLAGWQWLFIIEGTISLAVAICAFFLLPDSPLKTRWLTEEERQFAHNRIFVDTTGRRHGETSVWKGLREACSDPRTWLFCLMDNLHLSANGFKNFLPTVVEQMGFGTTIALVLTCPPYLFAGCVSILVSWSSGRYNERTWHTTISKTIAIVGFAICVGTLNVAARYVGIMLFVGATYGVNNIILGWTSSILGQSDEKKAVALALCNTFGNLSFVYTPYLWPDSDGPRFSMGMSASVGFSVGVVLCAWAMRIWLQRQNKQMKEVDPSTSNFFVY